MVILGPPHEDSITTLRPLGTVTPSLVILGPPHEDSITTLRPLGPMVTATASARMSTPASISALTSPPNLTSLAIPLCCREAAICCLEKRSPVLGRREMRERACMLYLKGASRVQ